MLPQGVRLHQAGTPVMGLFVKSNTGDIRSTYMYDYQANKISVEHRPDTGFTFSDPVTINGATNVVKKTGDTMTGTLNMQASIGIEGDRNIYRKDDVGAFDKGFTLTSGSVRLHDWKNNRTVWEYDQAGNTFNVNSNTNLVKKTGDVLTGDLQINTPNKGVKVGNGVEGITQMVDTNGRYYWYSTLAKTPSIMILKLIIL